LGIISASDSIIADDETIEKCKTHREFFNASLGLLWQRSHRCNVFDGRFWVGHRLLRPSCPHVRRDSKNRLVCRACSAAVTVHFLAGTVVVLNLALLYKRKGLPQATTLGVIVLSLGVYGWSVANEPHELFAAAIRGSFGRVTMGVAAVNAVIAP
jgi:hypothetical protein